MTTRGWTKLARIATSLMVLGLALLVSGWRIGEYVAGAAFLALLVTLDKPWSLWQMTGGDYAR